MNCNAIDRVQKILSNKGAKWLCSEWDGLGSITRNGYLECKKASTREIKQAEDIIRSFEMEDLVALDSKIDLGLEKLINRRQREIRKGVGEKW